MVEQRGVNLSSCVFTLHFSFLFQHKLCFSWHSKYLDREYLYYFEVFVPNSIDF